MKKKIGKKVDEPKPWYPKVESMVATQRRDRSRVCGPYAAAGDAEEGRSACFEIGRCK
jgi:hypothetical protein